MAQNPSIGTGHIDSSNVPAFSSNGIMKPPFSRANPEHPMPSLGINHSGPMLLQNPARVGTSIAGGGLHEKSEIISLYVIKCGDRPRDQQSAGLMDEFTVVGPQPPPPNVPIFATHVDHLVYEVSPNLYPGASLAARERALSAMKTNLLQTFLMNRHTASRGDIPGMQHLDDDYAAFALGDFFPSGTSFIAADDESETAPSGVEGLASDQAVSADDSVMMALSENSVLEDIDAFTAEGAAADVAVPSAASVTVSGDSVETPIGDTATHLSSSPPQIEIQRDHIPSEESSSEMEMDVEQSLAADDPSLTTGAPVSVSVKVEESGENSDPPSCIPSAEQENSSSSSREDKQSTIPSAAVVKSEISSSESNSGQAHEANGDNDISMKINDDIAATEADVCPSDSVSIRPSASSETASVALDTAAAAAAVAPSTSGSDEKISADIHTTTAVTTTAAAIAAADKRKSHISVPSCSAEKEEEAKGPLSSSSSSSLLVSKRKSSGGATTDGDEGTAIWKKRCLASLDRNSQHATQLPSLDEATDMLRFTFAATAQDASKAEFLKRDAIAPKEYQNAVLPKLKQAAASKKRSTAAANSAPPSDSPSSEAVNARSTSSAKKSNQQQAATEADALNDASASLANALDRPPQVDWVQCDACKKWRTLPAKTHPRFPSHLTEDSTWICSENAWAPHLASCNIPEENLMSATSIKIRVWLRRVRSSDRYEARNSSRSSGEGKRGGAAGAGGSSSRTGDVEWLRCCSATCGKWRACPRALNTRDMKKNQPWFCWMASWDETKASCTAPQESCLGQGYGVALIDADDSSSNYGTASYTGGGFFQENSTAPTGQLAKGGNGSHNASAGSFRNDDNEEGHGNNADNAEDNSDDGSSGPTIGISRSGRIVRSKFNIKKHLIGSRK